MLTWPLFVVWGCLAAAAEDEICRRCECQGQNVTCEGVIEAYALERIPAWTVDLYVWECRVPGISPDAFLSVAGKLRTIQIVDSDLVSIEPGTFAGMINLVTLDLSQNPNVSGLSSDIFADMHSLKFLNLSSSNMATLHVPDFAIFDKTNFPVGVRLQEISLSHSAVSRLSADIRFPPVRTLRLQDVVLFAINGDRLHIADSAFTAQLDADSLVNLDIGGSGTELDKTFFQQFDHLERFEASQSAFDHANLRMLDQWEKIRHLNLSRIELHQRPWDRFVWNTFPENLEVLDISKNLISDVHTDQQLPLLRRLIASDNMIGRFELLALLPNLTDLNLSHNKLIALPSLLPGQVAKCLRVLDLGSNRITTIIGEKLIAFPNLEVLVLRGNKIKYFSEESFPHLKSLQLLDLSQNELESFRFNRMGSVRELRLAQNRIKTVEVRDGCCRSLETLILSGNTEFLTNVRSCLHMDEPCPDSDPVWQLTKLTSLQVLDIADTGLPLFPTILVNALPRLQYLSVAENEITDNALEQGLLATDSEFRQLQFLNLSKNLLSSLSPQTRLLLYEQTFAQLDLSANEFLCSCELARSIDVLRVKLLRYFGLHSHYWCNGEDGPISIKQYLFRRDIRESCLSIDREASGSNLAVYMLLFVCLLSVAFSLLFIVFVRRRRTRCARDTYTSVDYVVLDSRDEAQISSACDL